MAKFNSIHPSDGRRILRLECMPARQAGRAVKFSLGKRPGSQISFRGNSRAYLGSASAQYNPNGIYIDIARMRGNAIRVTCAEIDSHDASGFTALSELFIEGTGRFSLAGDARSLRIVTNPPARKRPYTEKELLARPFQEEVLAHPIIVNIERKTKSGPMTLSVFSFNESFKPNEDPSCYMPVVLEWQPV